MSEPLVKRLMDGVPYRTALVLVFFTAIVVGLCAGSYGATTPLVWSQVAERNNITQTELRWAMTGGSIGLFFGPVAGLVVDNLTQMLGQFLFSALCFCGYFCCFWSSHGPLIVTWVELGALFFVIAQSAWGATMSGVVVVCHNAPDSRRGFVCGCLVGSFGAGVLVWSVVQWSIFDQIDTTQWYLLTLSLVVPLFYFLSAFLLRHVELPQTEAVISRRIESLFPDSADDETSFANDDDLPAFSNDSSTIMAADGSAKRMMRRTLGLRVAFALSTGLVVASSCQWQTFRYQPVVSTEVPYLWTGGLVISALLTGFFADFGRMRMAQGWWIFISGVVGCLANLLVAFRPKIFYSAQDILQGGVLGCAITAAMTFVSLEFGVSRMGFWLGLFGVAVAVLSLLLQVGLSYLVALANCVALLETCMFWPFILLSCTSGLGGIVAGVVGFMSTTSLRP